MSGPYVVVLIVDTDSGIDRLLLLSLLSYYRIVFTIL